MMKEAADFRESGNSKAAEAILKRCYDAAPTNAAVKRELFDLYQENVAALKQSPYMDYPQFIGIETIASCNAKCGFCPYPTMERAGTRMSDELIEKIVGDLKDIPLSVPIRISPFKISDPFVEPRLFQIIKLINRELPQASIDLYSNGAALTPKKFDELLSIKNFQYLNISLNDHRPDVYETLMKLPFDRTIARLTMVHEKLKSSGLPFAIVISRVSDYETDEDFRSWVLDRFPLFHVQTHRRTDFIGQVDVKTQEVPDIGCVMWFTLSIMANGIVAYCCVDGEGKFPIGDVKERHALAIYNEPEFRNMRERQATRLGSMPCGTCTFF
jgi:hypothetical protein